MTNEIILGKVKNKKFQKKFWIVPKNTVVCFWPVPEIAWWINCSNATSQRIKWNFPKNFVSPFTLDGKCWSMRLSTAHFIFRHCAHLRQFCTVLHWGLAWHHWRATQSYDIFEEIYLFRAAGNRVQIAHASGEAFFSLAL